MKKVAIVVLILLVLGVGWWLLSPLFIVKEVNEPVPFESQGGSVPEEVQSGLETVARGVFVPDAHEVEGRAVVIEQGGQRVLRFEDFLTINGPDLRIYLATDATASDFVDLGPIRGTKGNVNYEVGEDVDLEKYDTVLVWCRAFSVLFSYAELE